MMQWWNDKLAIKLFDIHSHSNHAFRNCAQLEL